MVVYCQSVYGYEEQNSKPAQFSLISPINNTTIVSHCSPKSLTLSWQSSSNDSDPYNIIYYSVYLYVDNLPPEHTDKIETNWILKTEYQVEIPRHWCDCYVFWYVRAINIEFEYTDTEVWSFYIDSQSIGYDCFMKGGAFPKSRKF
jgi:hypothetical protein